MRVFLLPGLLRVPHPIVPKREVSFGGANPASRPRVGGAGVQRGRLPIVSLLLLKSGGSSMSKSDSNTSNGDNSNSYHNNSNNNTTRTTDMGGKLTNGVAQCSLSGPGNAARESPKWPEA